MIPPLRSSDFVQKIAMLLAANEANRKLAGLPHGTLRGVVVSVDDPLKRGRVQVIFDDMNPDIPQITGAGEISGRRIGEDPDVSHWIDVCPAFSGKQPAGLVGKRVNITPSNGQYQYSVLQDVLFDPDIHATDAKKKPVMPNNSSMTRLPIYEAGKLPEPSEDNHGCTVVEKAGPYGDDWLCVCLQRSGKYIWVRHVDMQHAHAGANDTTSYSDTGGDKPFPGKAVTGWDFTFPTSAAEMAKYSAYGTDPRGNPYGDKVQWFPSPMSKDKPLPAVPSTVNDQDEALAFIRDSDGFTKTINGQIPPITGITLPNLSSILPFNGFNKDFSKMLQNVLDSVQKQAMEKLSQATGGASDQIIQSTNTQA